MQTPGPDVESLIPSAHNPRATSVALGEGDYPNPDTTRISLIPSAHNPRATSVALGEGDYPNPDTTYQAC